MVVLELNLTEKTRECFGTFAAILNGLLVIDGFCLITTGIFYKSRIESKFSLLEGYNAGTLAYMLILLGVVVAAVSCFGVVITYDCRSYETRKKLRKALEPFVLVTLFLVILVFVSFIMCIVHRSVLKKAFESGMDNALHAYKLRDSIDVKASVDRLQMEYHCCGGKAYTDWFTTSWISTNYLNVSNPDVIRKLKEGEFFTDDVPFSCCDPSIPRPCIHHALTDKTRHPHYGESLSIFQDGCTQVILDYADVYLLKPITIAVMCTCILEGFLLVLSRYLQTSIENIREFSPGNPTGMSPGFLIRCDGKIRIGEVEPDEEKQEHPGSGDFQPTTPLDSFVPGPTDSMDEDLSGQYQANYYDDEMYPDDYAHQGGTGISAADLLSGAFDGLGGDGGGGQDGHGGGQGQSQHGRGGQDGHGGGQDQSQHGKKPGKGQRSLADKFKPKPSKHGSKPPGSKTGGSKTKSSKPHGHKMPKRKFGGMRRFRK